MSMPCEDRCAECGVLLGFGFPEFHLGICEDCRDPDDEGREEVPIHAM